MMHRTIGLVLTLAFGLPYLLGQLIASRLQLLGLALHCFALRFELFERRCVERYAADCQALRDTLQVAAQ